MRELNTDLVDLESRIMHKADKDETKKIWDEFKNYSSYNDLKELYNKVLPQMLTWEEKM